MSDDLTETLREVPGDGYARKTDQPISTWGTIVLKYDPLLRRVAAEAGVTDDDIAEFGHALRSTGG